jgi:hypothetical protein
MFMFMFPSITGFGTSMFWYGPGADKKCIDRILDRVAIIRAEAGG